MLLKSEDIKNLLMFCLKKLIRQKIKKIQSKLHRIGTYDVCHKRHILDNFINSLAYFHKDVKSQ